MSDSPEPARSKKPFRAVGLMLFVVLAAGALVGYLWWKRQNDLPQPGSEKYDQYVAAFYTSLAALDVGVVDVAETNLNKAVDSVPGEPAGWANRGLLNIRTSRMKEAESDLNRANQLAPNDPGILKLFGFLRLMQGKFPEAAAEYRKALDKDPNDAEALFQLGEALQRNDPDGSRKEHLELLGRILVLRPGNLFIIKERFRYGLLLGDGKVVAESIALFKPLAATWKEPTREQFQQMLEALKPGQTPTFDDAVIFLNVLLAESEHLRGVEEFRPANLPEGKPLRTMLKLPAPTPSPAEADMEITFAAEALPDAPHGNWDSATVMWLTLEAGPSAFLSNANETRSGAKPPLPAGGRVLPIDFNNDQRTDLVVWGSTGLKFLQQQANGSFTDVTSNTKLPDAVLKREYAAALAVDYDLDGDIDILLAPKAGQPIVLRNNFDGTFKPLEPFPVNDARAFIWADLDHDGAPDVAILDAKGKLSVFANERSGKFIPWPAAVPAGEFLAMLAADADDDGVFDLVALKKDGSIVRITDVNQRASWSTGELAKWPAVSGEPGGVRLFSEDLDNNGLMDLVASGPSGSAAWLGKSPGTFESLPASLPPKIEAIADLNADGRLDLLAFDGAGRPVRHLGKGTKPYHWQTLRFQAVPTVERTGDNRINSFGIGGDIEIRTGTFVVKRPIAAPAVHFGLGTRTNSDVLRITWPNGGSQVEFNRPANTIVQAQQRLKGSCPFLFTWDGEKFVFVADFMWSTPLGMYINAQNNGELQQTREWVRIPGSKLKPKDGKYEIRVNANLWETHYFDHLALHVVDHPPGTELYCDERFALEPFTPASHVMEPAKAVAKATDHLGVDATEVVQKVDGKYLDRAGRGLYQGISRDHWVEVDLGDAAPTSGPVWLVAHGWIHPTDSSINFALEQGSNEKPKGLALEVPDGKGGWKAVRNGIGFPAGKNKTVLIRLDGVDGPGVSRRFRLRTNLEIFWDALHWAKGAPDAAVKRAELLPATADLRYRGILDMTQADRSSPELPHYDKVAVQGPMWRDLVGRHTRFGDIRELLEKVDDRYAILTAGDDVALTFAAPPEPPAGWVRDFVWVSDGWVKDGDLNTRFGKTVLPLPYHGMPGYDKTTARLEDDPVFKRFKKDWDVYHTRFVSPSGFERGLRPEGRR
jgi:cytochrome c-type biogenesis protein CcmH/NrfG